jgi:uncharacterized protein YndB with AHSA1/START domain
MNEAEPIAPYLAPLEKSVTVPKSPADAFRIFTAEIGRWWPLATHSISRGESKTAKICALEPFVGGEIYEIDEDGRRRSWGRVLSWDPPALLRLSWHPGSDEKEAQEVEVSFVKDRKGTRVTLIHSGWQKLGARGASARETYGQGWAHVFGEAYVAACETGDDGSAEENGRKDKHA